MNPIAKFNATITKDDHKGGWTYVVWDKSVETLGSRGPIKVFAKIEDYEFEATFLPSGTGGHLLGLRAEIFKHISARCGDTIAVSVLKTR